MGQDLRKPSTYAHNDKAQFSLPMDSFIYKLTYHHWRPTKSKQVCFLLGLLSEACQVYTSAQMAVAAINKQHWAIDRQITGCCCYLLIWLIFMMFQA